MTDYLRIMNVNIKNMKHIYFTHYRFYITQKLYICTINNGTYIRPDTSGLGHNK